MGEDLYSSSIANPKGFFEAPLINEINERILSKSMKHRFFHYDDILFYLPRFIKKIITALPINRDIPIKGQRWLARLPINTKLIEDKRIEKQIIRLISQSPFCFKDPRFSYTLPSWIPYIDTSTTVFIVMFRHPTSTVRSILKECSTAPYIKGRILLNEKIAFEIWESMYQHILKNKNQKGKWLFIHYEQLLNKSAFEKVGKFTGSSINRQFIEEKYYRSKPNTNMIIPSNCQVLYNHLSELAGYIK